MQLNQSTREEEMRFSGYNGMEYNYASIQYNKNQAQQYEKRKI